MSSTATFLLPAMIPNTQGNDSSYFPFIQFFSGGEKGVALEPPINKVYCKVQLSMALLSPSFFG